MNYQKLHITKDGLRKTRGHTILGINKGYNLGIAIVTGDSMLTEQLDQGEVETLVEFLIANYDLTSLPQIKQAQENEHLRQEVKEKTQIMNDSVERMAELKEWIDAAELMIKDFSDPGSKPSNKDVNEILEKKRKLYE